MASTSHIIRFTEKSRDSLIYDFKSRVEFVLGPNTTKVILERPYGAHGTIINHPDGTAINPASAGLAEETHVTFWNALQAIDGIYYVSIKGYRMQIKIDDIYRPQARDIIKQVMAALIEMWPEARFDQNSEYSRVHEEPPVLMHFDEPSDILDRLLKRLMPAGDTDQLEGYAGYITVGRRNEARYLHNFVPESVEMEYHKSRVHRYIFRGEPGCRVATSSDTRPTRGQALTYATLIIEPQGHGKTAYLVGS